MPDRLLGLVAAPHTPMHADGRLNLGVIPQQAQYLCDRGVVGVFVGGSTGEAFSLTFQERCDLITHWTQAAREMPLRVIIHVGSNCLQEACLLAAHAQQHRADAIAALAPFYHRPTTVKALVEFCAAIAGAATELPFYYYHIPALTHVKLPVSDFLQHAIERIPTLAGVKFTDNDLIQMQKCLQLADRRFEILNGYDEILLAGFSLGAQGAVGSTYNFAAPLSREIIAQFHRGNMVAAQSLQRQSVELIELIAEFGFPAAAKFVMALVGVDCGPVRPPLTNLSPEDQADLRTRLDAAGYFDTWLR